MLTPALSSVTEAIGAVAAGGAGAWALLRFLFGPRLEAAVRKAIEPEARALRQLERDVATLAEDHAGLGDRMKHVEQAVRDHETLRGTVEQLAATTQRSLTIQEKVSDQVTQLAVAVARLEGEVRATRALIRPAEGAS